MEELYALFGRQRAAYPAMELQDCIKLLYQNEFGAEHLLADGDAFKAHLQRELQLPELASAPPQRPEDIGNGVYRVHLNYLMNGPQLDTFYHLCLLSAKEHTGSMAAFMEKLGALGQMCAAGLLPYPDATGEIEAYIARGCPPLHHSRRFGQRYRPHYRLLAREYVPYLRVFAKIDALLLQKPHVLVCIDGMAAAGKTTLAKALQRVYGCPVIQADSFFLRPQQRTPQRLAEAGGNIDYERLSTAAAQAGNGRAFQYRAYHCQSGTMGEWRKVPAGSLLVIEGSYSLHPKVAAPADLRVFVAVGAEKQRRRVLQRNGPLAERFISEWIPMENRYFHEFGIRESCDLVLEADSL